MYAYMLEDWKTLSGAGGVADILQTESNWMSFQPYQDIVFHTECKSLALGGADAIQIAYETSPTKDDSLFSVLATVTLVVGQTIVTPILLASNPAIPLSRWVRYRLLTSGAAAEGWLATFRIHCSANAVGVL